jgi:putative restriction endonuclease
MPPLIVEPNVHTLLLGWSEIWALFAAFDVTRHMTFSQASPSIQFRQDVVVTALANGVGFHRRTNGETVVVLRPEFLMTYASHPAVLHRSTASSLARTEARIAEVAAVVDGGCIAKPTDASLERRDPVTAMVARALRDNAFPVRVKRAYGYACAACGLQFDVLDAAHIVPVSDLRNFSTRNGLCLCPNHHRAYDNRLVRIHGDFHIEVDSDMVAYFKRTHRDAGKALLLDSLHRFIRVPENPLEQPAPNLLLRRLELDGAATA